MRAIMKTIRHRLSSIIEYGRCALKRDEESGCGFPPASRSVLLESITFMFFRSIQPENIVI